VSEKEDDFLDPRLAKELRDEAIRRVGENNGHWVCHAHLAIINTARKHREFTTDRVWVQLLDCELEAEPRAMGAAVRAAERAGIIKATDRWELSAMKTCNRRPKRVWRSLMP